MGAIGYSLQCGSTEDSSPAPQPCWEGAVPSHRALRCFLAPSRSLSSRRDVKRLESGYSYHKVVAENDCVPQQPTVRLVSCQQSPGRVKAAQGPCTRSSEQGTAFPRHILQPSRSSERMGLSTHSSGNWTQPSLADPCILRCSTDLERSPKTKSVTCSYSGHEGLTQKPC